MTECNCLQLPAISYLNFAILLKQKTRRWEKNRRHPDGFIIFAGDFNRVDVKTVFAIVFLSACGLHQQGDAILDLVYITLKKATPLSQVGFSGLVTGQSLNKKLPYRFWRIYRHCDL